MTLPTDHHMVRSFSKLGLTVLASCLGVSMLGSQRGFQEPAPYGLEQREAIGPFLDRKIPSLPPTSSLGWQTVPAFPRLTFQDPVFLTHAPRSRRLYVCGRQGIIESFENDPETATKTCFLDLSARCQGWDDSGLLGMAFHPEFGLAGSANRGYVYVVYNYAEHPTPGPDRPPIETPTCNRLSRFTVPDGSDAADPESELVLIDQQNETLWHNGGGIFFHPDDGFLYLSMGDEGYEKGNTQKIDRDLFSSVIRIDVDQRGGDVSHPPVKQPQTGRTAHYFIPNDNPWVGVPDALEEFYCLGLRSPHRMTYDPLGKRIWLGDVGESSREEINLIEKGGNYQWRYKEGTIKGTLEKPDKIIGEERPPIYEYSHTEGNAVIGGYVYRGREQAGELGGKYIFGDINGSIWAMTYEPGQPPAVALLCTLPSIPSVSYGTGLSSFGEDAEGELYLCQMGQRGQIFKLSRVGKSGVAPPKLLSQAGVFRDTKTLEPAPGLIPYNVNVPLWSDGAAKKRWIAVPKEAAGGERIGFAPTGEWIFPVGTVFVKHFELETDETAPGSPRRLETRLLVIAEGGSAYGITYKWNAEQTDAELLEDDQSETITIQTAQGPRRQTWYYPNARDCQACHSPQAGYVLGVKTRQLNRPFDYPATGVADNQIRAWNHIGLFFTELNEREIPDMPRLAGIDEIEASLEHRARSYLDANCAYCHRPNGVRARFDARFDTDLAVQGLIDGDLGNPLGNDAMRVITAQDPSRSMAHLRMESREPGLQMPPLARNVPDARAIEVIRGWIESLPARVAPPETP